MSIRSILPLTKRPSPSSRPALELGRRAVGAEADLEPPRQERERRLRLGADEALEVAAEALAQLGRLDLAELEPHAEPSALSRHRSRNSSAGSRVSGVTRSLAELLRQAGVEGVERLVGDLAAQQRVGLGVDRLRVDDPLEEPGRRAVDEALELGRAEDGAAAELREHRRVAEPRVAPEGAPCALEAARPAVRVGEGERELGRLARLRPRAGRARAAARARSAPSRSAR